MRRSFRCSVAAVLVCWAFATPSDADGERALTLAQTLELARAKSPAIAAAQELPEEARGDLTAAELVLQNNPEVALAAGPRSAEDGTRPTTNDFEIGLEQRFEIGGQRRHRIARATAGMTAANAGTDEAERLLDHAIAEAFYEALAADETLRLQEEARSLATALEDVAQRRLDAGEGTPLELNTARIRSAESLRRVIHARGAWKVARIRLAELVGLSRDEMFGPKGQLPTGNLGVTREELVIRAGKYRPELQASMAELERQRASFELAKSNRIPDLSFGMSASREEEQDVLLAGISISLPIFNQNQGQRQRTEATLRRREAELQQTILAVDSDFRRALEAYDAALSARRIYSEEIVAAHRESLQLLQLAFDEGEVSYAEVIVVHRELLDGQIGRLAADLDLARSAARLLAAVHLPQTLAYSGGER